MVISLVLSSQPARALKISFDSPSSVDIDEEFDVNIDADSSDTFDVKIFVHTSNTQSIARNQYISEIYDGSWQDSWYYLTDSFPDEKTYRIRVVDDPGDRTICVRLRKSGSDSTTIDCEDIEVNEGNGKSSKDNSDIEDSIEQVSFVKQDSQPPQIQELKAQKSDENLNVPEKIMLNSPTKEKSEPLVTKTSKNRLWIIYSFSFFTLLIIVLLALRKL